MFINYRRAEPGNYAAQIYPWASKEFGDMDAVSLEPAECRILLVVIGDRARVG